jgi:hypothetical protein
MLSAGDSRGVGVVAPGREQRAFNSASFGNVGAEDITDACSDAGMSSEDELLNDSDVLLLTETMRHKYVRELSDVRGMIWTWSEHIDEFLRPYIGFSLFLAPERYFRISRFTGLATMLFAVVLGAFIAGGGKYGCAVCTVAYPFYCSWKFLQAVGQHDKHDDVVERDPVSAGKGVGGGGGSSRGGGGGGGGGDAAGLACTPLGRHFNAYVQWATYWVIVGAFEVAEQVATALFFADGLHWLYWYAKLLLLFYCYFPRTQGATVLYWAVLSRCGRTRGY